MEHHWKNEEASPWFIYIRGDSKESPVFFLEFSGLPFGQQLTEAAADALSYAGISRVVLGSRLPLVFCPWCGRNLAKRYKKHWKELIRPSANGFD
jgi:hypothetical protein